MFSRQMKYIVVEFDGLESIMLFPSYIDHREFAARVGLKPLRAGFVQLCDGKLSCSGESVGLNLSSDPAKDTKLLNRNINFDFEA